MYVAMGIENKEEITRTGTHLEISLSANELERFMRW